MKEQIINKYSEDGICYPYMTLNIRSLPCATTGDILDQYYEGESVIYDYVVITDKYVWISWISSGSSRRVYMAVKEQSTGERLALCTDIPIGSGGNQGAETITNEYAEDLSDMLKMGGVVIPVGEHLTISAKPVGLYGVEITAEVPIDVSFIEEKFKNHPIYVRVVITIFKNLMFNRLHVPAYTRGPVYQIEAEAGVDWEQIAETGSDVINGIAKGVLIAGAIAIIGGSIFSGVGAGFGLAAASAGLNSIAYMYSH